MEGGVENGNGNGNGRERGGGVGCVDGNDARGIYCGGGSLVVGLAVVVS